MQKRTDNFSKFAEKKKGAAIKEAIRQEKRKIKAEARAIGEEMRAKKKAQARGEVQNKSERPVGGSYKAFKEGKAGDKKFTKDKGAKLIYRDWEIDRKSTRLNSSH